MTAKVVYSERLGQVTEQERALETELHATLERVPLWTLSDIEIHAKDADALIVGAVEPLDRTALSILDRCRIISRRGVGVNNIDLEAATELGIPVAFVPAASVQEVSDHSLALLLALERRVGILDSRIKSGGWTKSSNAIPEARDGMRRLAELTLGVIGFGRIGQELVRKALPSFDRILVYDPFVDTAARLDGVNNVDLDRLLEESDLISLHAPLIPETRHLFDETTLARVKPGATIVNTSRGGLIDTEALVRHLESGRIGRAGLDVTEEEPIDPDSPLLTMDNVILTGHSAAASDASAAELRRTTVQAVIDALSGQRPEFLANPEVFDRPNCRIEDSPTTRRKVT